MILQSHNDIIDKILAAQGIFSSCYFVSALFVASNSYGGFVCLLSGLLFGGFTAITYYGIRKHINRTFFGIVLGGAVMLIFVSLESAIFWGQYSRCSSDRRVLLRGGADTYRDEILSIHPISIEDFFPQPVTVSRELSFGVECNHTSAMKSVCTFSIMMFLSYVALVAVMIKFKNEILGPAPLNEGYIPVSTNSPIPAAPPSLSQPAVGQAAGAAFYSTQYAKSTDF